MDEKSFLQNVSLHGFMNPAPVNFERLSEQLVASCRTMLFASVGVQRERRRGALLWVGLMKMLGPLPHPS